VARVLLSSTRATRKILVDTERNILRTDADPVSLMS